MSQGSRKAARAAVLAVTAALLVFAAAAFAVTPTPGAAYKGHLNSDAQTAVTFAVSKDGKFVVNMRLHRRRDRHRGGPHRDQQADGDGPVPRRWEGERRGQRRPAPRPEVRRRLEVLGGDAVARASRTLVAQWIEQWFPNRVRWFDSGRGHSV
jgi:hypothetical protein